MKKAEYEFNDKGEIHCICCPFLSSKGACGPKMAGEACPTKETMGVTDGN